jgi:hypothetical protein
MALGELALGVVSVVPKVSRLEVGSSIELIQRSHFWCRFCVLGPIPLLCSWSRLPRGGANDGTSDRSFAFLTITEPSSPAPPGE